MTVITSGKVGTRTGKRHKGIFWGNDAILHFDGGWFIQMCKISKNVNLRFISLYVNLTSKEKRSKKYCILVHDSHAKLVRREYTDINNLL